MKPYRVIYNNPSDTEITGIFTGMNIAGQVLENFTVRSFTIESDNKANLEAVLTVSPPTPVDKPIVINKNTIISFPIQPNSNLTLTLYPAITIWQRIKNFLGL